MSFRSSQVPLLKCQFAHRIPGRVRLVCRAVRYLSAEQTDLENHFSQLRGVRSQRMNCAASSVILTYDPAATTDEELLESVESLIQIHSLSALRKEREERNPLRVAERDLHEESLATMLTRAGIAGTLLAGSWIFRRAAPATVLGRVLTPTGFGALALATPIFRSGVGVLLRTFLPNADTLSALAIVSSVVSGRAGSALTVLLLHDLAESLTAYTMNQTRNAIRDMLSVDGEEAWRSADGKPGTPLARVPVSALRPGDFIVVHTGEKIVADGEVVAGRLLVDQSSITGEFGPVPREAGGKVYAGTLAVDGTATIRVESVGEGTAVSRIIRMVEDAEGKKAEIQTYADRFSSALVPVNITLALAVFLGTRDVNRALNMLVIDYSCGIRLSTAAALSAAISTAARNGVLIKGGGSLQALTEADTLILDKTGTLTEGKPRVTSIATVSNAFSREEVLALAAAAEETSRHPMANAILAQLQRVGGKIPRHQEIHTVVGRGVWTKVGRAVVRVGSKRFLNEAGIHTHPMREQASRLFANGESVIYVARGTEIVGLIGIRDPLRENMKKALNRLRLSGVDDILLLTGDQEQQADVVARRLGLDGFESELMPEDKAKVILRLQAGGNGVVMVGDGINDAPGLAYADVGIALGKTRTDVAMEAADITIAGDNAMLLPATYGLARQTMDVIRQNFFVSVGVNTVGLLLGGLGLIPVIVGATLHNASTILVVGNSLRIFLYDMRDTKR